MLNKHNYHNNSESSESDIESQEDEQPYAKNQGFGYQHQLYTDSDDQEESQRSQRLDHDSLQVKNQAHHYDDSSEEEDDDYNPLQRQRQGIHTVREDPDENDDEDSMDHIEERIKKLQRDLENRLGKTQTQKPGNIVSKPPAPIHPPIPAKQPQKKPILSVTNENRMGIVNEAKKTAEKAQYQQTRKSPEITVAVVKKKKVVEKPPQKEAIPEPKIQQRKINNNLKRSLPAKCNQSQPSATNRQVEEMQKIIDELRTDNRKLKEQLEQTKQANKKKPLMELQKLKDISHKNGKLEKQIQLLQVIEKLQTKLKKSINKKLGNQKNTSSTLLHKGLPANILNQI